MGLQISSRPLTYKSRSAEDLGMAFFVYLATRRYGKLCPTSTTYNKETHFQHIIASYPNANKVAFDKLCRYVARSAAVFPPAQIRSRVYYFIHPT
ncbi:hypothetical protein CEP53_011719 [Fusarium sp. AF-6]|nr:hypothetical protein CEP53_011719 [Fusarium sp. AF-6]